MFGVSLPTVTEKKNSFHEYLLHVHLKYIADGSARQPVTLQFASEKLRGNKDVVLGAVKSLPQAFQFARDGLRRVRRHFG